MNCRLRAYLFDGDLGRGDTLKRVEQHFRKKHKTTNDENQNPQCSQRETIAVVIQQPRAQRPEMQSIINKLETLAQEPDQYALSVRKHVKDEVSFTSAILAYSVAAVEKKHSFRQRKQTPLDPASSLASSSSSVLTNSSSDCDPAPPHDVKKQFDEIVREANAVPLKYVALHHMLCERVPLMAAMNFDQIRSAYEIDCNKRLRYSTVYHCFTCESIVYNAHNIVAGENCMTRTNLDPKHLRRCCCIVVLTHSVCCGRCLSSFNLNGAYDKSMKRLMASDAQHFKNL